jgi:mRNA-degrading endonuclease RelE of RelBE toxin-antitoxin system
MELAPYRIGYRRGWDRHFDKLDAETQRQILKKIEQMKSPIVGRGLHSSEFRVEEVGGYRIVYALFEAERMKSIHFVGSHKQYEKWYSSL